MRKSEISKIVLLTLFLFCFTRVAFAETRLCPHVILKQGKLKLNANEKILVCGTETPGTGWSEVPLTQAQYELEVILENSGYLKPEFRHDDDLLYVSTGDVTATEIFEINGTHLISSGKKRKIVDQPLKPQKLDEAKKWAEFSLERQGYACPKTQVNGLTYEKKIRLAVDAGQLTRIRNIQRVGFEGLDIDSLRRFEAFNTGEVYDIVNTQITTARLLNEGIFQSAFLTTECHGEDVDFKLGVETGKPRVFNFGFGASTEELPFVDVLFKNARLDDRLSNYTLSSHLSPIRQSFDANSELYVVPLSKRSFFAPRFHFAHRKEIAYELNENRLGVDFARYWDEWGVRFEGKVGPSFNYEKTIVGVGPEDAKYLSWDAELSAMSHAYEAFTGDQYEGWTADFKYSGQRVGVGSNLDLNRYDLDFKHLWNIGAFSPPLFIFATRLAGTSITSNQLADTNRNLLPIEYRVFYGGDENIRGFGRETLNNNNLGYLTAVRAGFELRLIEEIAFHLQPFLLWDVARLGSSQSTLDAPVFTSPGLGLRWPSPFGTLRFSAARGEVSNGNSVTDQYPKTWIFFVSFGQEF